MNKLSAEEIYSLLDLRPHPEGGAFVETFRDLQPHDRRGRSSAIYYLLKSGERSNWHRIDAVEIWHFYAGAPIKLEISRDGSGLETFILGTDLSAGERPQIAIPQTAWQSAHSLGAWTLVGCTVAPAFSFDGFELAPEAWKPTDA